MTNQKHQGENHGDKTQNPNQKPQGVKPQGTEGNPGLDHGIGQGEANQGGDAA